MKSVPSMRHNFFIAGLASLLVFLVGYGADLFLLRHPTWMLLDDVTLALGAALVVFHYERERSRFLAEKLRVIRDMNAFVRNELQILNASVDPDRTRVTTIERSVERIDWALRELLPGKEKLLNTVPPSMPSSEQIERSA